MSRVVADGNWVAGVDPDTPHPARIYDYGIGGKNNFPADRAAADQLFASSPYAQPAMRENRRFLHRAVATLAARGITQFVDIGAGLPTGDNTHQVAHRQAPHARIVYLDNDPVVLAHARALLAGTDKVRIVAADARDPDAILDDRVVRSYINWAEPVAVLMVGLLHFITDDDKPEGIVQRFRAAMAPGSCLALSHGSADVTATKLMEEAKEIYSRASTAPVFRSRERIEAFFDGFTLLPPGVVHVPLWRPDGGLAEAVPAEQIGVFAGVGELPVQENRR